MTSPGSFKSVATGALCSYAGGFKPDKLWSLCAQARLVPADHAHLKVYSVSTHRLAYYLDGSGKLLPLIQGALLQEMGFPSGNIRLQNLL